MKGLTFGEVREYCSRINKVQIYLVETEERYEYNDMGLVPPDWNNLYLNDFGILEDEFYRPFFESIEFILSKKPGVDPLASIPRERRREIDAILMKTKEDFRAGRVKTIPFESIPFDEFIEQQEKKRAAREALNENLGEKNGEE